MLMPVGWAGVMMSISGDRQPLYACLVPQVTQAVAGLATKRRLLISGTPIQNDLTEFFAVFDTALPGQWALPPWQGHHGSCS